MPWSGWRNGAAQTKEQDNNVALTSASNTTGDQDNLHASAQLDKGTGAGSWEDSHWHRLVDFDFDLESVYTSNPYAQVIGVEIAVDGYHTDDTGNGDASIRAEVRSAGTDTPQDNNNTHTGSVKLTATSQNSTWNAIPPPGGGTPDPLWGHAITRAEIASAAFGIFWHARNDGTENTTVTAYVDAFRMRLQFSVTSLGTQNAIGGTEKLTNPYFYKDLTGWTNDSVGAGTATWYSVFASVLLNNSNGTTTNSAVLSQSVSVTAGKTYYFKVFKYSVGTCIARIGTTANGTDIYNGSDDNTSVHTNLKATQNDTWYITFRNDSYTGNVQIFDVAFIELPESTMDGSGKRIVHGSGDLEAAVATVDGSGARALSGTGDLEAAAASMDGAAVRVITGSGGLAADVSTMDGAGSRAIAGTGTLVSVGGTGAELLTNNSFTTDLSGWTDASTGTASIAWALGGKVNLPNGSPANQAIAQQDVVVTPGKPYRIDAIKEVGSTSLLVGTTTDIEAYYAQALSNDDASVVVIPTESPLRISLRNDGHTGTATVLEASVKEALSASSMSGAGHRAIAASGDLDAVASTLDGAGYRAAVGTGDLQTDAAVMEGDGSVGGEITGTGDLQADTSTMDGAGIRVIPATGALATDASTVNGAAVRVISGTGSLVADDSVLAGTGQVGSEIVGTGDLAADDSTMAGAGTRIIEGTGALVADDAVIAGAGNKVIDGRGNLYPQEDGPELLTNPLFDDILAPGWDDTSEGSGDASRTAIGEIPGERWLILDNPTGLSTQEARAQQDITVTPGTVYRFRVEKSGLINVQARAGTTVNAGIYHSDNPVNTDDVDVLITPTESTLRIVLRQSTEVGIGYVKSASVRAYAAGVGGPELDGTGTVGGVITGTGSLVADDSSVDGAGDRILVGAGDMAAVDSDIDGAGSVAGTITGTGSLTAVDSSIAGSGAIVHQGTGSLAADDATLDGAGSIEGATTGTGDLAADVSSTNGAGLRIIHGDGSLEAGVSTMVGTASGVTDGTGDLVAANSDLDGSGARVEHGTGDLTTAEPSLDGTGARASTATGDLQPAESTMEGSGVIVRVGSGDLVPLESVIQSIGARMVHGDGGLVADASDMFGIDNILSAAVPPIGTEIFAAKKPNYILVTSKTRKLYAVKSG